MKGKEKSLIVLINVLVLVSYGFGYGFLNGMTLKMSCIHDSVRQAWFAAIDLKDTDRFFPLHSRVEHTSARSPSSGCPCLPVSLPCPAQGGGHSHPQLSQ